ncbi:hypothetical protein AWJ20_3844 [Sugiyamaella lignohabitans]|uniref:Purple acid phosphatase n=1 Tax=Sugiyamaella lignohabitans TaxID=796027 RepID=A0A161HIN2_9ASCO|nr:uncharacterized protein AWJ20_3844 [Sugiyamaella lignohabitans]ANB11048.1 hypothetical protein AWJ20_3844 [Sugiyamaella lignohabitans]
MKLTVGLVATLWVQLQLTQGLQPVIRDYSNPSTPASQFRLAYNGAEGVTVSWNSPSQINSPQVWYGEDPNNLVASSPGTSTTFSTATSWDNHVTIGNLKPNTKYYYRVTGLADNFDVVGQNFYFTTARTTGDRTPYSIGFIADLGIVIGNLFGKQIPDTFDSILSARDSLDFLWHSGDFGYADDWLWEELTGAYPLNLDGGVATYNNIMNSYYDQFVNVTKNTPYMVGPGNHEADCIEPDLDYITNKFDLTICPSGQRNFTYHRNHFAMPTAEQAQDYFQNLWYSWNHGMTHFVQINTETDLAAGTTAPDEPGGDGGLDAGPFGFPNQQLQWLEADLAAVDRTKTPWLVVAGHRPWYSASTVCTECQEAFENLVIKYKVDLVMAGHVHYYERDAPVANGVVDPNGLNNPSAPWYITNGAAGNFEGHSSNSGKNPSYTSIINNSDYGWSKLTFHNSTHLTHDFISSETDQVLDTATLYKDHGLGW